MKTSCEFQGQYRDFFSLVRRLDILTAVLIKKEGYGVSAGRWLPAFEWVYCLCLKSQVEQNEGTVVFRNACYYLLVETA